MTFLDLLPRRNHKETTSFLLGGFDNFGKLSYRISHRHAFSQCEIRHLTFFSLNILGYFVNYAGMNFCQVAKKPGGG